MKTSLVPKLILGLSAAIFVCLGIWICLNAPFASGTDESIRYVAFAAAKHRWATEEDYRRWGIDHFYYAPLYYLCFAPFYEDEPAFVSGYPKGNMEEENYVMASGRVMVRQEFLSRVPPVLVRLYRNAKLFSLALGLVVLSCLVGVLSMLFHGPGRWWFVLLGSAPVVFLPQFLYYQTLCNNDSLVNALGALAILSFVAAMRGGRRGSEQAFTAWSLVAAACVGLAVLTKLSGLVLTPLLPGLVAARLLLDERLPRRSRALRAAGFSVLLLGVAVAAGGWWIIRQWGLGDWSGAKAHRLAHPWAFWGDPDWDLTWLAKEMVVAVRSYFGLFLGAIYGIPDWAFTAYLAAFAAALGSFGLAGLSLLRKAGLRGLWSPRRRLKSLTWTVLIVAVGTNALSLVANLIVVIAPYGRFMFLTLAASHALLAAAVRRVTLGRRTLIRWFALIVTAWYGILFFWIFTHRMADAVAQRPETVRTLSFQAIGGNEMYGPPLWDIRVEQALTVPPGTLAGFRVNIEREWLLPQFGCVVQGELRLFQPGGRITGIPFRPAAVGDNDASLRWTDLLLEAPVALKERTAAAILLRASPPSAFRSLSLARYVYAPLGNFPNVQTMAVDGNPMDMTLCLAAVYAPGRNGTGGAQAAAGGAPALTPRR